MTPLRMIQAGLGGWGRDWARMQARHAELAMLVAYTDVQPAMLEALQQANGGQNSISLRSTRRWQLPTPTPSPSGGAASAHSG